MNRRHFLPALGAAILGCGEGVRRATTAPDPGTDVPDPGPCPTCDPSKPRPDLEPAEPPPDPPAWPVVGVEHLPGLSQRYSDPRRRVQVLHDHGVHLDRVLTVLARWGSEPRPGPGWYVDPLSSREWHDRRDAWLEECRARGVIAMLCLFDEPLRWNRPEVIDALRSEYLGDVSDASTWLDMDPGWPAARELAEFYLEGVDPHEHPGLVVETTNEPHSWPAGFARPPDDQLAAWLRGRGFRVARGTRIFDDGPYADAELVCEHSWGPPGAVQPWPPWDRLDAIRRANPGAHVMVSTDGFGVDDYPEAGEDAGEVLQRGFSFAGLVRVAPDRWGREQRDAVERMVASVGRGRRAA